MRTLQARTFQSFLPRRVSISFHRLPATIPIVVSTREKIMKSIVFLAMTVACALAFVERTNAEPTDTTTVSTKQVKEPKEIKEAATASKDLKDAVKAAKEAKKNKKDLAKDCGTEYDPICVHDPNDASFKPRTFGSECALDVYNYEMGTKLVTKSKGECPGSGGVRLS